MNIYVRSFRAYPSTMPIEGDRHYMELTVDMSRAQLERAVVEMLGKFTDKEAEHLLKSEFPMLFMDSMPQETPTPFEYTNSN